MLIERALRKKWGEQGAERAELIRSSFPDVNPEAVAWAIVDYVGVYPPYPKDIADKVGMLNIDGVFQQAVRRDKKTRDEQLSGIRRGLMKELE